MSWADPYTAVLVLATLAPCAARVMSGADHWLYNPDATSGFHRVGFYSNVDVSFLPRSTQSDGNRVSIYIERAYVGGQKPTDAEVAAYQKAVEKELQDWGFIGKVEVNDPTWIDVAYTWARPARGGSRRQCNGWRSRISIKWAVTGVGSSRASPTLFAMVFWSEAVSNAFSAKMSPPVQSAGSIAAVVVTRNRLVLLQECVNALRVQTRKVDEIIVVDNGSDDGTATWLSEQKDIIAIIQGNTGGAGGQYTGAPRPPTIMVMTGFG